MDLVGAWCLPWWGTTRFGKGKDGNELDAMKSGPYEMRGKDGDELDAINRVATKLRGCWHYHFL
jgi:hypothetical protein